MGQLFELYKSKDRDADELRMRLYAMSKEKEFIQERRDAAFNALSEMIVERRRMIGYISDYTQYMGATYMNAKKEVQRTRDEGNDFLEHAIRVWSSKIDLVPKKGKDMNWNEERREAEYKLQLVLKEVEVK
jgi:hypothetical protein